MHVRIEEVPGYNELIDGYFNYSYIRGSNDRHKDRCAAADDYLANTYTRKSRPIDAGNSDKQQRHK